MLANQKYIDLMENYRIDPGDKIIVLNGRSIYRTKRKFNYRIEWLKKTILLNSDEIIVLIGDEIIVL